MNDNAIVLRMTDICKYYPGVKALDHVNLELRRGEVHALLGENGAGKSTICKIIAGAQPKDLGKYVLFGKEIENLTPQAAKNLGISMIYQEFNLIPYLKVYENLFLGKEMCNGIKLNKKQMIKKTVEVFKRLDLDINPETQISDLTNAYKQLVEIAKAILEESKILIMDEPTAPLGNHEVDILFNIIHKLKEEGVSIIYISHRLEEIFEISDRITVMRDGQYIATLNTKETNEEELVRQMVGRTLGKDFPQRNIKFSDEEVLRVEGLSTSETKIKNVSFTLYKGEVLGFAGLVGSGRTETMRAIFGADPKISGRIFVKGKEVKIEKPIDAIKEGISLVPEDRKGQGISLSLPIRANISMVQLKSLGTFLYINPHKEKKIVKKYIDELSIKAPSMEQLAKNLSGGNQQKVVVAKWLATQSDVIILDEPTRGIDVGAKYEIYMLMNQLIEEGKSLIMISSEMPELIGMSDRIIVMHEGRVAGELSKQEITQEKILIMASGLSGKE